MPIFRAGLLRAGDRLAAIFRPSSVLSLKRLHAAHRHVGRLPQVTDRRVVRHLLLLANVRYVSVVQRIAAQSTPVIDVGETLGTVHAFAVVVSARQDLTGLHVRFLCFIPAQQTDHLLFTIPNAVQERVPFRKSSKKYSK